MTGDRKQQLVRCNATAIIDHSDLRGAPLTQLALAAAEALPGVRAVVTAKDFPPTKPGEKYDNGMGTHNLQFLRDNVLATDKVLYSGHPVAAVCATSVHIAEEALDLIEVEYEVLQPVVDIREAMRDDAGED